MPLTKAEIVRDWLPRYTGRSLEDFGNYVRKHLEVGIDSLAGLRDSGESVKHMRF